MIPWEAANALEAEDVAARIGLEPAREARKFECPSCASSDALHAYRGPGRGFHCFSCGTSFSNVDAAAAQWGIEPKEAALRLVGRLPTLPPPPPRPRRPQLPDHELRRLQAEIFGDLVDALGLPDPCRRYLSGRGIDPDAAELYGLRGVTSKRDVYAAWNSLGEIHGKERLQASGLGVIWAAAPALVLPYWSATGAVCAIRLRSLDPPTDRPKYVSPSRGAAPVVFNREALEALKDPDLVPEVVIVCEGELDALLLHQRGHVAVGLPGACPSADVLDHLARALTGAPRVALWTDPDSAGDAAADRIVDALVTQHGPAWVRQRVSRWFGPGDATDTILGVA